MIAVDEAGEVSSGSDESTESDLGQDESVQVYRSRDSDASSEPSFTGIPTSTPIASPQTRLRFHFDGSL